MGHYRGTLVATTLALLAAPAGSGPLGGTYRGAPVADAGRVTGRVIVRGAAPAGRSIPVTRDEKVCGTSVPDERLVIGEGGGVVNAVVSLEGIDHGKPVDPDARATLERRSCLFVPHVQTLVLNQVLEVRNSDPLPHTTRALLNGEEMVFSLALPIQNQAVRHKVKTEGVLHLQSDDADWMSGYLVVTPHPYAVVTGRDGRFALDEVPPGSYTLRVWHESLGNQHSEVVVPVRGETAVTVQFDQR